MSIVAHSCNPNIQGRRMVNWRLAQDQPRLHHETLLQKQGLLFQMWWQMPIIPVLEVWERLLESLGTTWDDRDHQNKRKFYYLLGW